MRRLRDERRREERRLVGASAGAAASRNSIVWPGVGSSVIESSGWIVGTTHDTLAMSVEPEAGSMPWSTTPAASAFATQRSRERAVVVHRRRAARELDLDLDVGRARGRLAHRDEPALHGLVVGLVGAAEHEPRLGPVRDDVRGRAALLDDPVDAACGSAAAAATGRRRRTARSSRRGRCARSRGPTPRGRRSR